MPHPQIRELLLSRAELLALAELRGSRPRRILTDGSCGFWFDLGTRHLAALTEGFLAVSQDEDDEALATRPRWHESPYTEDGQLLFENVLVEDIVVVRSLLWFTDLVRFQTEEQALAGLPSPRNATEVVLRDALAGSTGGYDQRISNPRAISEVTAPVVNLVDVGFTALVGGRSLACFTQRNCYWRDADFVDELQQDVTTSYELVPLERALQGSA